MIPIEKILRDGYTGGLHALVLVCLYAGVWATIMVEVLKTYLGDCLRFEAAYDCRELGTLAT